MKIILDLRKYDGVVGGVEQGALQIAKNMSSNPSSPLEGEDRGEGANSSSSTGNECVLVCKKSRETEVRELLGEREGLKIVTVDIDTHAICDENRALDAGFFQDLAEEEGADLIHFFYNWSFPKNKKVPSILTVHDVIPFTFQEAMADDIHKNIYKPGITEACELNDFVATVSEFSKNDISETVGVPLEKIRVVYNGLREPAAFDQAVMDSVTEQFGLEKGYILNAGGIHERKNIARMVKGFAGLVEKTGYEGKLLITGAASGAPYQEEQRVICDAAIAEAGMQDRVVFGGFVSEDELDNLLRKADVFIYPSLYEGFGIPILESMKVSTPCVTSNVTAMPEVAGGAALLVDPTSVEEITDALARIIEDDDLRADLLAKGLVRAAEFSWERNGEEYMSLYRETVEGSR